MRLKVANAYSNGKHQILWLAGGYAVLMADGKEEIFESLEEAAAKAGWQLEQDTKLLSEWSKGYELPADEDQRWPEMFLVKEEQ